MHEKLFVTQSSLYLFYSSVKNIDTTLIFCSDSSVGLRSVTPPAPRTPACSPPRPPSPCSLSMTCGRGSARGRAPPTPPSPRSRPPRRSPWRLGPRPPRPWRLRSITRPDSPSPTLRTTRTIRIKWDTRARASVSEEINQFNNLTDGDILPREFDYSPTLPRLSFPQSLYNPSLISVRCVMQYCWNINEINFSKVYMFCFIMWIEYLKDRSIIPEFIFPEV